MFELTPEIMEDWKNALNKASKEDFIFRRLLMSMNPSQLVSKRWLVDEIPENIKIKNVVILGGWFSPFLPEMLLKKFPNINVIENVDMDPECSNITYSLNKRHKNIYFYNVRDVVFDRCSKFSDLIINTSCEHMYPMKNFISDNWEYVNNSLFVFQSNNERRHKEHINCVDSEEELIIQSGLTNIIYSGQKELPNKTKRFMVIGKVS